MNNSKISKKYLPLYIILRSIIFIMSYIPLPVGRFMGNILGFTAACLPMGRHSVAMENIEKSLIGKNMTGEEIKRLTIGVYMHYGRVLFEIPHVFRLNNNNVHKYFEVEGGENLENALRKGKGVLALTAHLGNWELMAVAVNMLFGKVAAVARPMRNQAVNLLIQKLRTHCGMEVIPKQKAMRKIMAALKKNMILGILLDQSVDWYEGEFLPFIGRTACVNKGLALLAMKTGSPVLPIFALGQENGRYRIHIGKAVDIVNTGDKTSDLEANTLIFTRLIEEQVIKYPDQWFWFHRRWKTANCCPLPRD